MIEYTLETLPTKLRTKSNMIFMGERIAFASECELMDVAANEIEYLMEERDRYREALELIVKNYEAMSPWDNKLIIPNLRIANEALEGEK